METSQRILGVQSTRIRGSASPPSGLNLAIARPRCECWGGVDIPFNRARSTVKAKQYAAAGVPWLASPVGQYGALGPRQGGQLVEDDEWRDALHRLTRRPHERAWLAARARFRSCRKTLHVNIGRWDPTFGGALERAQERA